MKSRFTPLASCLLLLLSAHWLPTPAFSQAAPALDPRAAQPGSIEGQLFAPPDSHGKSVAGISVTIVETGQTTTTDKHGNYTFDAIAPGTYTLVATAEGYSHLRITDVSVSPNHSLTLSPQIMPIVMKDGEIQTMAEVVVHANKDIETMTPVVVTDTQVKPQPFSDRDVDLPRGIDDVQPYYIFDSQTIQESGTLDVEDFLKEYLTMDTTVQTNSQITRYQGDLNGAGNNGSVSTASSINLEGLGTDHTLILVNGLPMAGVTLGYYGSGPGQPDLNGIPLSAIDRIEVLPSSAGAIYGGDAEGGVINVILKKAYSGGDITETYGASTKGYGPTELVEASLGRAFEDGKTQLFVTAQYSDSQPEVVGEFVNLLNRGYNHLLTTNPGYLGITSTTATSYRPVIGATPNIGSVSATYPVPSGTAGVTTANQKQSIGFVTSSGLPTTAADPWVLTEVEPLTLKSTGAALGGTNPYIATVGPSGFIGGQWNLAFGNDNEGPNGLQVPLGNYPTRKSVMATLTRRMNDWLQLHFDYSHDENSTLSDYNPLKTQGGQEIYANNPNNPFNQAVYVSYPVEFNSPADSTTTTNTITIGGTVKLPFNWVAHMDYQWSENIFSDFSVDAIDSSAFPTTNISTFATATYAGVANTPDPNPTPQWSGAINPFTATLSNPINWAPFTTEYFINGKSTEDDLVLAASGPLFHLPWGDPRLSIYLHHDKSGEPGGAFASSGYPTSTPYPGLPESYQTIWDFGKTQTTNTANAELDIPVFKTQLPLLRSLDAQINFSNETTYTGIATNGYSIVPAYAWQTNAAPGLYILGPNTVSSGRVAASTGAQPYSITAVNSNTGFTGPAISYKPTDDIILRFSTATGFVPPSYSELIPDANLAAQTHPDATQITDPLNPGAGLYYITEIDPGGNPGLKPETSRSWNVGGIYEPKSGPLKGFRFDAEFTETRQHNLITSVSDQFLVDNENVFPGFVVRDPTTGLVDTVYNEPVNVNEAKNELWDFTLDYRWQTAIGSFDLNGAETIEEHDQQQLIQGGPFVEYVGFPNSGGVAKTKANVTLRWANHGWIAAWSMIYYDGYKQYGSPGDPEVYQGTFDPTIYADYVGTGATAYLTSQGGWNIPSQTYYNLFLGYAFPKGVIGGTSRWARFGDMFLDRLQISLSVNDVFNTFPPFDVYYTPFFTSPYGPLGRSYLISVKKTF